MPGQGGAGAHAAFPVQGAGDVRFQALVVPAADDEAGAGLEGLRRPLAHHVDGGRRVALAAHQARGATDHFDAVVQDRILQWRIAAPWHAVDLEIVDAEAARIKRRALRVVLAHLDARRLRQRLVQAHGAQVVEQLARDDADRLRRFAQGQVHARGAARLARRVGACAFRAGRRLAQHGDGGHGHVGRRGIGSPGRHGRAGGKGQQGGRQQAGEGAQGGLARRREDGSRLHHFPGIFLVVRVPIASGAWRSSWGMAGGWPGVWLGWRFRRAGRGRDVRAIPLTFRE